MLHYRYDEGRAPDLALLELRLRGLRELADAVPAPGGRFGHRLHRLASGSAGDVEERGLFGSPAVTEPRRVDPRSSAERGA